MNESASTRTLYHFNTSFQHGQETRVHLLLCIHEITDKERQRMVEPSNWLNEMEMLPNIYTRLIELKGHRLGGSKRT